MHNSTIATFSSMTLAVLLMAAPLWADDFSNLSNAQMLAMEGTVNNAPDPERQAFRKEWRKRLNQMRTTGNADATGTEPASRARQNQIRVLTPVERPASQSNDAN